MKIAAVDSFLHLGNVRSRPQHSVRDVARVGVGRFCHALDRRPVRISPGEDRIPRHSCPSLRQLAVTVEELSLFFCRKIGNQAAHKLHIRRAVFAGRESIHRGAGQLSRHLFGHFRFRHPRHGRGV